MASYKVLKKESVSGIRIGTKTELEPRPNDRGEKVLTAVKVPVIVAPGDSFTDEQSDPDTINYQLGQGNIEAV